MSTDRHHAATLCRFGVKHVELCLQIAGIFLSAEEVRFIIDDVIHVQRIWNDREWFSFHVDQERLIPADVVNVINEAKLLENLQRVWCATKPEGIETQG